MIDPDPAKLREFETWLSLFTEGAIPDRHRWKAWFCVAEYEAEDFERVSDLFLDRDATASFAVLGRDAEDLAAGIEAVADAGHEVAFHSHRHHAYADLSYDEAHDAIATGLAAVEDATGITPTGFFVPFLELSEGAVRAVEEVGFDWVLGRPAREPAGVTVVDPESRVDVERFERTDPDAALSALRAAADAGEAPFLFHPPVVEYYDAWEGFEAWVEACEPSSVAEQLSAGGTGVVLDCVRPVRPA